MTPEDARDLAAKFIGFLHESDADKITATVEPPGQPKSKHYKITVEREYATEWDDVGDQEVRTRIAETVTIEQGYGNNRKIILAAPSSWINEAPTPRRRRSTTTEGAAA